MKIAIKEVHLRYWILLASIISALFPCGCSSPHSYETRNSVDAESFVQADVADAVLEQRAIASLGDREGTVLVIDPRNGRLRAIVNQRMAFEQSYPPGSAIKPFTVLAAMQAGILERETKHRCRTRYARDGYEVVCSHPQSDAPFNLPQALAYSCNDYFGVVGERLSEGAFTALLHGFGFGERLGVSSAEAAGSLPRGEWRVEAALGDSDRLLVTPVQMLSAYSALINDGHLFRPMKSDDPRDSATEISRLRISREHRDDLIEGMRGAVKYGTAAKTGLGQIPFYVFGKTGTSESSNGFRTQGWFAGFAAQKPAAGVPQPEQIKLGVLVFLRRAHGSQAADIATAILNCGMPNVDCGIPPKIAGPPESQAGPLATMPASRMIKVRAVRENLTRELPLEEYLVGVVSSEASIETKLEAMKAQAVASRSYATSNLGRHAGEGYDFCSLTHCQQFILPTARTRPVFRQAVLETSGEVLQDEAGNSVEAYFHAACGGVTSNIEKLWGAPATPHLHGVRDDFCAGMPNRHWNQAISADRIRDALNADPKTNIGDHLNTIVVVRRDETGRVESLAVEGEKRRIMRGWDFKIAIGRAIGWQMIKSSRFDVVRTGSQFVFHGSGFGHGIGLCQNGSHVMAARGMNYRQILQHFFPGTRPGLIVKSGTRTTGKANEPERENQQSSQFANRNLQSANWNQQSSQSAIDKPAHFRFIGLKAAEAKVAKRILEKAYQDFSVRFSRAGVAIPPSLAFEILAYSSTEEFMDAAGQSAWAAGATRGRRIELQPLSLLVKRGILATTLRHELAHAFIEGLKDRSTSRWLAEGAAIHLAGEGPIYARLQRKKSLSPPRIEQEFAMGPSRSRMRELYRAAYAEVQNILRSHGEAHLLRLAAGV